MNSSIKVSIILPVYNVDKYISDCLNSIINQTYSNIEVLVIDDGSPDDSGKIADEYAMTDSRIKVIHKRNGGVASARNTGLKEATGEFVIFVDPDDWISADHVEYLLFLQQKNNADVCMTTKLFTQKGELQCKDIRENTISATEAAIMLMSPDMYVGSYSKLYRRMWLLKNEIWQNESIYSGEGLHFTVKAVQYANCVTVSNKKIYYYRRNVSTSATTKFNIKMFSNNEYSLDVIKQEQIVCSNEFDTMINLFRIHLFISGILAIEQHNLKKQYEKEYIHWMKAVKANRMLLLTSNYVPFKSKIRILGASLFPKAWSRLANIKRRKIFKESV